jgi:hypothetical protein
MKSGPIKPLRYDTKVDRRKVIITEAWARQEALEPASTPAWFGSSVAPAKPKDAPVLLVTTTKTMPDDLKGLIKIHLEAGGRAYLLAAPSFDPATELKALTDAEKALILLRQLPRAPQSGYHHEEAGIWYAPLGDRAARLHLKLSRDQAQEWRYLFLRAFWHEAEKEQYFTKGKWTSPETCWSRPVDIAPRQLTCWQTAPDDQEARKRIPQVEVVHSLQATRPGSETLYTKPDFNAQDLLRIAADKGVDIFGLSTYLPECYLQETNGWLISGDKEPLILKLNAEQTAEARGLLALSQTQVYLRSRDLASLHKEFPKSEYLLPDAKGWDRIALEWPVDKAQDLGRVTARSLDDVTRSELRWEVDDQKLKCPELALAAHFIWEVVPPVAPSKIDDLLYGEWKQHTQACADLKDRLIKRTRELSELNSGWSDDFQGCFEDASGLTISFAKLGELLDAKYDMELSPQTRQALMDQLQAWLDEVNHAHKLLNQGLLVQDWLNARAKHNSRIFEKKAALAEQLTLPTPNDDATPEVRDAFNEHQKERARLEGELTRLQKEQEQKYRVAPSDKSEHVALKALRPLDKAALKPCPKETLPTVGRLYAAKGSGGQTARFLAITDWADQAEGLKEAERLGASLVAEVS